jgi:hypothetical protein
MHPTIINNIIKILRIDPPLLPRWEDNIAKALSDENVIGPKSLEIALLKIYTKVPVDQSIIRKINLAIKRVEAKSSPLNIDIDIIISQTSSTYDIARSCYLKHNGDIVSAILEVIFDDLPELEPA